MVHKKPELGNHKCDEAMDWNVENNHEGEEYVPPGSCLNR